MDSERTRRGVRAAVAVAARHGVPADDPAVLRDAANLLVHLRPAPVVARVATTTAEVRAGGAEAWLRREVDVGRHLASAGAPAAVPADLLPPGPHREDGLVLTFWRHVDHDPARPLDPAAIGRTLRQVHDALASYAGPLPPLAEAMDETRRMLHELGLAEAPLIERALRRAERAMAGDGARPVHGDTTRGNLLRTPDGPIWNDFEEACVASPWWDLACLATTPRRLGLDEGLTEAELDVAFASYGARRDDPALASYLAARAAQVTAWSALLAVRDPAERPYLAMELQWWRERAPGGC